MSYVVRVGPRVGSTGADIAAQQVAVKAQSTSISAAVASTPALSAANKAAWYALAAKCLAFVSAPVPILQTDAMFSQGKALLAQLAAWPARVKAAGGGVVPLAQVPAPQPRSDPMTGTLGDLLRGVSPVVLFGVLWLMTKGNR